MPRLIKICGMGSPEDARLSAEAGADMLGLIFVPDTPRYVTIEQAKTIQAAVTQPVKWVGVFQNAFLDEIQNHMAALSLDFIQLHGAESVEFCRACPAPVIKVLSLGAEGAEALVNDFYPCEENNIAYLLADLPKGSELTLNEALTPAWCDTLKPVTSKLILAGKLTPETVGDMIERVHPAGVDVASGVESAPGQKDPQRVRVFCQSVRSADERTGVS